MAFSDSISRLKFMSLKYSFFTHSTGQYSQNNTFEDVEDQKYLVHIFSSVENHDLLIQLWYHKVSHKKPQETKEKYSNKGFETSCIIRILTFKWFWKLFSKDCRNMSWNEHLNKIVKFSFLENSWLLWVSRKIIQSDYMVQTSKQSSFDGHVGIIQWSISELSGGLK